MRRRYPILTGLVLTVLALGGTGWWASRTLAQPIACNILRFLGAAPGADPTIVASGCDTNININFTPKGTGVVKIGGGALVTGAGTAGFLPRWTAGTALGNSLFFQDTANSNLLAVIGPGTVAADMATFVGVTLAGPNRFYVDQFADLVGSLSVGGFNEFAIVGLRGTYAAPTKILAGDSLGDVGWFGYGGVVPGLLTGPSLDVDAVTDLDVALPVFRVNLVLASIRDQIVLGSNTLPGTTLTNVHLFGQGLSSTFSHAMVLGFNGAAPAANTVSLGVSAAPELVISANLLTQLSAGALAWSTDLFLTRGGAALLHLGALDAAASVAQSLGVQNVVGGTTDTAGALWNLIGSRGTGTGVGGDVAIQVAYPGTTASTQNPLTTVLDISASNKSTNAVQNLVSLTPTVNQSGTAGYNGLYVNVLRTAVGSGVKQILALAIGGVQRFGVTDGTTGVGLQLSAAQVTPPTCSANCGTTVPAVVGSDFSMIVTMGSGGTPTSPFTVTFNGTYPAIPSCQVVAKVTTTAFVTTVAPTQTTVVVTTATNPAINDSYNVVCTPVV